MSVQNSGISFPLFVVDAFAEKPFEGNGAAVVLVPHNQLIPKEAKQKIAEEMNRSETAFITPKTENDSFQSGKNFKLDWFTPTCEVLLCGHATLASAAVLFKAIGNKSEEINFDTLSGILKAKFLNNSQVEIDLPAYDTKPVDTKYDKLVKAVAGSLPVKEVVLSESKKVVIRLCDTLSRADLESVKPKDSELLTAAPDVIGVILTLNATDKVGCADIHGQQFDFISRYFVPWLGLSEDPVTGSAHSVLAPYWSKILKKNNFYARQCSPRGGNLSIDLVNKRVYIRGNAAVVIKGEITL